MTDKTYDRLSHDEQIDVISKVTDFMHTALPKLIACGRVFQEADKQSFKAGIHLLSYFVQCRPFCMEAEKIRSNFDQYTNRMAYLFDIVKTQLAAEMNVLAVGGQQMIVLPQQQTLRRGRPTAAESEQREVEKRTAQRAEALSKLTGAKVASPAPAAMEERPSDTSRRKAEEPDLFDAAIAEEIENLSEHSPLSKPSQPSPLSEPSQPSDPVFLKSPREWFFMLPDDIANDVKALKDNMAARSIEAEKAKSLAESGASESEIGVHTMAARDINEKISDTYENLDSYLGLMYVMLTKVNKEWGRFAEKYAKHGGYDVLVNDLKPYWEKMMREPNWNDWSLKTAQKWEDDRIAAETRDPELEKEIHKIKAYFSRKDVNSTQKRLETLIKYYDRAVELSLDADTLAGFQVIIDKVKSDLAS